MEKLVEIFPDPLNLIPSKNTSYLESKLNLKNLTNNYVIFKIFNNNSKIYSAKPSKSFIPPKETKNINIKRFTKEEISSNKGKDQFLLLFYTVDKIINNNDEAKEAFDSKLYNPESKQESLISVIINDDIKDNAINSENIYNENDLNEVGDDEQKEIKIYDRLINNLRNEYNKTNQNIVDLEKMLEVIQTQKKLKYEKDKAISVTRRFDKKNYDKIQNNIILISIILLGLVFGANLACKYNKVFIQKKRIIKQIIINTNENFIQNKINEFNNIKSKQMGYMNNDFLTWKFFIALYLCFLGFII